MEATLSADEMARERAAFEAERDARRASRAAYVAAERDRKAEAERASIAALRSHLLGPDTRPRPASRIVDASAWTSSTAYVRPRPSIARTRANYAAAVVALFETAELMRPERTGERASRAVVHASDVERHLAGMNTMAAEPRADAWERIMPPAPVRVRTVTPHYHGRTIDRVPVAELLTWSRRNRLRAMNAGTMPAPCTKRHGRKAAAGTKRRAARKAAEAAAPVERKLTLAEASLAFMRAAGLSIGNVE